MASRSSSEGSGSIVGVIAAVAYPGTARVPAHEITPSRDYGSGSEVHHLGAPDDPPTEGTHMLQWKNGRLISLLVAVTALAVAIGNWGWEHLTWGW